MEKEEFRSLEVQGKLIALKNVAVDITSFFVVTITITYLYSTENINIMYCKQFV